MGLILPQVTAASGGSRYITNPKHLPLMWGNATNAIHLKTAVGTTSARSTTGFITNGSYRGASAAITVADTYVTLCDISGAGFMGSVVTPYSSASAAVQSMRITVDGTAYEITETAPLADYCLVLGGSVGQSETATTYGGLVSSPNAYFDSGFNVDRSNGVPLYAQYLAVFTPEQKIAFGLPVLRFDSSLKVEVKCSVLSATNPQYRGLVTYVLDQ